MDLNLLSVFQVVADAPSFSAAAQKLGLRRSSISRSIASLEKQLGVQLFNRTTRSLALTTAGAALLSQVRPNLLALADSLSALPEREQEPSGSLRLTAPEDIGALVLPELITGFSQRFPAVELDVRLTNRQVDLVGEGFDAAFRVGRSKLDDSSLVARKVSPIDAQVFASPAYLAKAGTPRTLEEAAHHEWVAFRGFEVAMTSTRKPRIVADDMLFVHRTVRAGAGLGMMPWFLARADLAAGMLVRVLPRVETKHAVLYLVHPPARHVARKLAAFRDYAVQYLAQNPLTAR